MIQKAHEGGATPPMLRREASARRNTPLSCGAFLESLADRPLAPEDIAKTRTRLKMLSETLRAIAARMEAKRP